MEIKQTIAQILNLLRKSGKTISTAESITAGYLQTLLTSVSGASDVFRGGITAYQLDVKVNVLGVDAKTAASTNCVDAEIAKQMAAGALKLFESDYAIATCGYAEPYPDENIPTPCAFIAIASSESGSLISKRIELTGGRTEAQQETAQRALDDFYHLLNPAHTSRIDT